MRIRIITNIKAKKGLSVDYLVLRNLLEADNHTVVGTQFDLPPEGESVDLNIFCETVVPAWFEYARQNWIFPNPEFWFPHYDCYVENVVDLVCCKTRHAETLFKERFGDRAVYTGFASPDHYNPDVLRDDVFLHICGGSKVKNTQAVLDAWETGLIHKELIVVGKHFPLAAMVPWVTYHEELREEALIRLQNRCRYHILPSMYEGYGHAIHEGHSTDNIVLTLDAPPMNEPPSLPVFAVKHYIQLREAAMGYTFYPQVVAGVKQALAMNCYPKSREAYLAGVQQFTGKLRQLLEWSKDKVGRIYGKPIPAPPVYERD